MENLPGFLAPLGIALLIFILNLILPGRWVTGYVTRTGTSEKLKYRINGIFVLFTMLILWLLSGYLNLLPFDWLYQFRWEGLAGACALGIIFSLAVVLPHPPVRKSFAADLFFGRKENMQLWGGRIDAKMWLYLFGAVLLEMNVLSFAAHQWMVFGENASPGIFLSAGLLTWFVIDYLTFEEVHLYTYDLFAERVGFKLGWGCLVFYPYFYAIPLWSTAALPDPEFPAGLYGLASILFFAGWSLSRGANLQKYQFKKDPERIFLGIVPQTISNGDKTLLISGFWGLSRHINYLGEILMASGIVLAAGHPGMIWPWLYPLYYVALLFTRQADDDRRCQLKYGELWSEYKKRVPYRIIPYIY
jgi:protein-S-isoprenylcysteine O-methyltransferase Ste14